MSEIHGEALTEIPPAALLYNQAVDPRTAPPGTKIPPKALNTITMWLGGEWMLRRDGKAIPVTGPVPDSEKDPQHNAIYEDTSKPKGKRHWFSDDPIAYGHRPMEETVGAIVHPDVLEFLISKEMHKYEEQLIRVEDPIKKDGVITTRVEQIRAANPPDRSWDGRQPLVRRNEADDLREQLRALREENARLKADPVRVDSVGWRGQPPLQPTTVDQQLAETNPDHPEPPRKRGKEFRK